LILCNDVEKISGKKCEFLPSNRLLDTTNKKINYSQFDDSKINFIYLGRYHQNKGIDLLIEAISLLDKNELKKTKFHIFGGGPLEQKIKELVKDFDLGNNTIINSWVKEDEVFSYISKSDFVIIPSRIESIPVILSNAIDSNKPILLTDVGDMGSIAKKFNVGIVTEPNPTSIARGIQKMMNLEKEDITKFTENIQRLQNYLSLKNSAETIKKHMSVLSC